MHDFKSIGAEIGELVQEKNAAYGDSFAKSGEILKILFPNGVQPDQYQDLLAVTRILDKLFRIATARDALGESPFRDIAGYCLLGIANQDARAKVSPQEEILAAQCGFGIPASAMDLFRGTLADIRAGSKSKEAAQEEIACLQYTGPRYVEDGDGGEVGIVVVRKDWQDDSWYSDRGNRLRCGPGLLFDPRLVQAVLHDHADTFHQVVADHYDNAVAPRFDRLEVQWVEINHAFRVIRVDGGERVVDAVGTEKAGYPAMMVVTEIRDTP